jgi:hypothetical protein
MNRRAFVFLPLVFLLALSAAALGIIYGLNAPPKQSSSAAYNQGYNLGPMIGLPVVAAFFFISAGRFAERRGTGPANAMFGAILALFNIAVGINVYRVITGKPAPKVAQTSAPSTPQPQPFPYSSAPAAPPTPPSQPPARTQPAPPTTAQPPRPAPIQHPTPAPAPDRAAQDAKAAPILETFKAALLKDLDTAAAASEGLAADLIKPPPHDKRILKERAANAAALRNLLVTTRDRLNAADDTLEKDLRAAGFDALDARHRAMSFTGSLSTHSRAFTCDRLIDFCDRVTKECELLEQNFSEWTLTRGEITVRNPSRRHLLTSERFFIEVACRDIRDTTRALREP